MKFLYARTLLMKDLNQVRESTSKPEESKWKIIEELESAIDMLRNGITNEQEWQEKFIKLSSVVPQLAGEALIQYPFLFGRYEGHEWDNRTTIENAVWLITIMSELLKSQKCFDECNMRDAIVWANEDVRSGEKHIVDNWINEYKRRMVNNEQC